MQAQWLVMNKFNYENRFYNKMESWSAFKTFSQKRWKKIFFCFLINLVLDGITSLFKLQIEFMHNECDKCH